MTNLSRCTTPPGTLRTNDKHYYSYYYHGQRSLKRQRPETFAPVLPAITIDAATATAIAPSGRQRKRPERGSMTSSYYCLPLLALLALLICIRPTDAQQQQSLRILLTNDDGIDKLGLQTLRTALIQEGHDVFVYAPAMDRTGLSSSVSLNVPFTESPAGEQQFVIEGPPASCVVAGLTLMEEQLQQQQSQQTQSQLQSQPLSNLRQASPSFPVGTPFTADFQVPPPPPPITARQGTARQGTTLTATAAADLVIVGISDGFPTGPQTLHSSSVGAALTALARGVPTLTVAALPPPVVEEHEAYFQNVADFTVRFLKECLVTLPLNRMPKGFGIKIAYPEIATTAGGAVPTGIQLANDGLRAPISLGYVPSTSNPNVYQITAVVDEVEIPPDSESAIVDSGQISILPIAYRYYVLERDFNVRFILTLKRMIRGLQP